jgi:hypothetical protein
LAANTTDPRRVGAGRDHDAGGIDDNAFRLIERRVGPADRQGRRDIAGILDRKRTDRTAALVRDVVPLGGLIRGRCAAIGAGSEQNRDDAQRDTHGTSRDSVNTPSIRVPLLIVF